MVRMSMHLCHEPGKLLCLLAQPDCMHACTPADKGLASCATEKPTSCHQVHARPEPEMQVQDLLPSPCAVHCHADLLMNLLFSSKTTRLLL